MVQVIFQKKKLIQKNYMVDMVPATRIDRRLVAASTGSPRAAGRCRGHGLLSLPAHHWSSTHNVLPADVLDAGPPYAPL
jgi:hypothetical protein